MNEWGSIATVVAALLAVAGAIYGVRKTSRIDREKLTQQWATIFGEERQKIALELKDVEARADILADQLRATKEEYSEARIQHREAIAEKNDVIREKDAIIRDNLIQLHETQELLATTRLELIRSRHEIVHARATNETLLSYIRQERERGNFIVPPPFLPMPHDPHQPPLIPPQ